MGEAPAPRAGPGQGTGTSQEIKTHNTAQKPTNSPLNPVLGDGGGKKQQQEDVELLE